MCVPTGAWFQQAHGTSAACTVLKEMRSLLIINEICKLWLRLQARVHMIQYPVLEHTCQHHSMQAPSHENLSCALGVTKITFMPPHSDWKHCITDKQDQLGALS